MAIGPTVGSGRRHDYMGRSALPQAAWNLGKREGARRYGTPRGPSPVDAARERLAQCDTIDRCVPPKTIVYVLRRSGSVGIQRRVLFGFLSEYVASKPDGERFIRAISG